MDEISDHAKVLTLSDDLERTVEERVNILFDFVKVKHSLDLQNEFHSLSLLDTYYFQVN
jgi:protein associated with RNAse G/E